MSVYHMKKVYILHILKGKFSFEMLVARGCDVILTLCSTVLLEKLTGF